MNPQHLKSICATLNIGLPVSPVTSVPGCRGGSFMWHVNTDQGNYAIKQLSPAIDLANDSVVKKYELSETIANRFMQNGIHAVSAIEQSGKHLFIFDNLGYLVYPWIDAHVLDRNQISETHALMIAEVIAKLHIIKLDVPEAGQPRVDIHTNESIAAAIDKTLKFECASGKVLKENQKTILDINDSYQAVIPFLLENTIVSHGDIDQLNVLWDKNNQPILIDWESVRKLNPTREMIRASLVWSGIGTNNSSQTIYSNMLRTYINNGGVLNENHVNAALCSVFGSSINWMLFNINIACNSDDLNEKDKANEEVKSSIMSLLKYQKLIPDLMNISKQVLS